MPVCLAPKKLNEESSNDALHDEARESERND